MDYQIMIRAIDESLRELGTAEIIVGRKARDGLLDLRLMCTAMEALAAA